MDRWLHFELKMRARTDSTCSTFCTGFYAPSPSLFLCQLYHIKSPDPTARQLHFFFLSILGYETDTGSPTVADATVSSLSFVFAAGFVFHHRIILFRNRPLGWGDNFPLFFHLSSILGSYLSLAIEQQVVV